MADLTAQQLLEQFEAFERGYNGGDIDHTTRVKLQAAARRTLLLLENPYELVRRLLVQSPAEQLVVRLGADLRIFELLAASEEPQSVQHLAAKTNAEPSLLYRILRALAAFGVVKETGEGYVSVSSTAHLAQPAFAKAYGICQDWMLPIYQALPQKLEEESYKLPQTDPRSAAVSYAYKEDGKTLFDMLAVRPKQASAFGQLMNTWGQYDSLLPDVYPVEGRLAEGYDGNISNVMFVDVGGGWGQKSQALRMKFPQLPGRIIVQDLPHIIASAPETTLCELTSHDFFTPQPVISMSPLFCNPFQVQASLNVGLTGPRAFYIRQTLHNWPDADCVRILSNLRDAMKPGYTRLLIHELIVPAVRASPWGVTQDFTMLTQLATLERTEQQWRLIIDQAGLSVSNLFSPEDEISESVIEIERRP